MTALETANVQAPRIQPESDPDAAYVERFYQHMLVDVPKLHEHLGPQEHALEETVH